MFKGIKICRGYHFNEPPVCNFLFGTAKFKGGLEKTARISLAIEEGAIVGVAVSQKNGKFVYAGDVITRVRLWWSTF